MQKHSYAFITLVMGSICLAYAIALLLTASIYISIDFRPLSYTPYTSFYILSVTSIVVCFFAILGAFLGVLTGLFYKKYLLIIFLTWTFAELFLTILVSIASTYLMT